MKTKYLVILSLIFALLILPLVSANRGMMIIGPREVGLQESGQNAIVAWNGNEEVIILSTDAKSSESILVLEVLPLPSSPTKVEEGSFDSFTKLTEIINKKVRAMQKAYGGPLPLFKTAVAPGVEVTFHKKIGAHDVTVVKVNDLDYFVNWVKNFTISKGFEYAEISLEFKNSVESYLNKDIKFFVFDVIETGKDKQSVKPLIYRFASDFLYYPLEITATSDAGWSSSMVSIFLITKGTINKTVVINANLGTGTGFDYNIELTKKELGEVSPELEDLFKSDPLVMNALYFGSLNRLNKDLVVYQQDIHILTFFDKISHRISQRISASLIFQYVPEIEWREFFTADVPIWAKILAVMIPLLFIIGILSTIFFIAKSIKKLLRKYDTTSFSYDLLAYVIPIMLITLLLFSSVMWLAILVFIIFTCRGFLMVILLVIKFFKRYVF